MGSAQSTHKVTVTNDNAHIIKVSDSVIDRIKNSDKGSVSSALPSRPATTITSRPSTVSTTPSVTYGGSLTSLQVLQEKEKQLRENDAYWADRVRNSEAKISDISKLMGEEFNSTAAALEARVPKRQLKLSEAPCEDKKSKVLECFKSSPRQILNCSKEVAEFADCVDLKRLAAV